jgi:hypothetical protein
VLNAGQNYSAPNKQMTAHRIKLSGQSLANTCCAACRAF